LRFFACFSLASLAIRACSSAANGLALLPPPPAGGATAGAAGATGAAAAAGAAAGPGAAAGAAGGAAAAASGAAAAASAAAAAWDASNCAASTAGAMAACPPPSYTTFPPTAGWTAPGSAAAPGRRVKTSPVCPLVRVSRIVSCRRGRRASTALAAVLPPMSGPTTTHQTGNDAPRRRWRTSVHAGTANSRRLVTTP